MRGFQHPPADQLVLEHVLHALADPVRLEIVRRLATDGPLSCSGSCTGFALPRATLSRHYGVLRAAGLVETTRLGVQHENRLRTDDLERRFPGLLAAVLAQLRPARPSGRKARSGR